MTGTMLKSMAVVLTMSLMACGGAEGPAVKVALQLVRSRPGLDTSDIRSFFVKVDDVSRSIPFTPAERQVVTLKAPPGDETAFVVFGCESDSCSDTDGLAKFVGCTVQDLQPGESEVVVTVELDVLDPLPPTCSGLVDP
jgi:hypothetical protein